jgi:predicted nucleic acid-binding protein
MSRIFVDTNLLVYANDDGTPMKRDRARAVWDELLRSQDIPVLSTQVLQEYYNTLTKKLKASPANAKAKLLILEPIETIVIVPSVILAAADLHASAWLSFWDALIVTAAQSADCEELWTEDLQDGQRFGKLKVVNPFKGLAAA